MSAKLRVLVVDDSALVRQLLKDGLNADPGLTVVATAGDPYDARDKIVQYLPDVITLDVEMPRMDGIEFLRKLMSQHPLPVVMVSSLTQAGRRATFDALEAGAVDFVAKPTANMQAGLRQLLAELRAKLHAAAKVDVRRLQMQRAERRPAVAIETCALEESTDKVIAIGASTGGTEAIFEIVTSLPRGTPGVVVVQHMPPKFTQMYAERLDAASGLEVREAKSGDRVLPGRVLIAPGGLQMRVVRRGGRYEVECAGQDKVCGHCPSVEVLFDSVAQHVGRNAVAALLTGMGADGASGLLALRRAGARTLAQDEATCVVYGMPRVAVELGAAEFVKPLPEIANVLLGLLQRRSV